MYPCTCSRSDVEAAASAPHVGQEGPRYPGTCAHRTTAAALALGAQAFSWRFRASQVQREFTDCVHGLQTCLVQDKLGDFVVGKVDGSPAYQLAVVVDDHAMGVTEVVRGDDLLPSTFRQLDLYDCFGWQPPTFAHAPLVIGEDGRRLAKRHGDTRLSLLRERGVPAEKLVGLLAWSCGLAESAAPVSVHELIPRFNWQVLSRSPFVFTTEMLQSLLHK